MTQGFDPEAEAAERLDAAIDAVLARGEAASGRRRR